MAARFDQPLAVFTSYSHSDGELRNELRKHLTSMVRHRRITEWHDRLISPGANWRNEIAAHLETAHLVLLLVSPDFLHSQYCYDVEMARALERQAAGDLRIVPVLLRAVDWREEPFAEMHVLPANGMPVCSPHWATRDEAFLEIANGVRRVVAELSGGAGEEPEDGAAGVPPPKEVEIHLNVDLERFRAQDRDRLMDVLLNNLQLTGRVQVVAMRRGSTVLVLEMQLADAERLVLAHHRGELVALGLQVIRVSVAEAGAPTGAARAAHSDRHAVREANRARRGRVRERSEDLVSVPVGSQDAWSLLCDRTYQELKRIGPDLGNQRGRGGESMRLVDETFRKLASKASPPWSRDQVAGALAAAARKLRTERAGSEESVDLNSLGRALDGLREQSARSAEAFQLVFFLGLSTKEAAELLGLSPESVERDLRFARSFLSLRMRKDAPTD